LFLSFRSSIFFSLVFLSFYKFFCFSVFLFLSLFFSFFFFEAEEEVLALKQVSTKRRGGSVTAELAIGEQGLGGVSYSCRTIARAAASMTFSRSSRARGGELSA